MSLFLSSLSGETSQQDEKTCISYSKMLNANDSSMNGTCINNNYNPSNLLASRV